VCEAGAARSRFYYQPQGVTDGEEKLAKAIHEVALAGHGAIESGVFSQEQTCPPLVHTLIRVAENRLERGELFVAESWMVAW